jgi:hypothetical protein
MECRADYLGEPDMNMALIAKGFGVEAEVVQAPEELIAALERAQGDAGGQRRRVVLGRIKASAVAAPRADVVVIPSTPHTSPLRAHNFVGNEALVAEKTVQWLQGVGLAPAAGR